eukprot:CAMPEP_0181362814 /NCGR_PEP_ID=MMETSP1106-20121128/8288_1 /TAXON_ID=81844 /ORGANISM="Mantoniella antarctica, Strain SL-175" /LENGTH=229 /DNA_ID=CAMNT_0023476955 /DNA_START=241 /DNA_END=930 /DNA_ORIENTATION=-
MGASVSAPETTSKWQVQLQHRLLHGGGVPKVVVVGCGWKMLAAVSALLRASVGDVTLISPSDFVVCNGSEQRRRLGLRCNTCVTSRSRSRSPAKNRNTRPERSIPAGAKAGQRILYSQIVPEGGVTMVKGAVERVTDSSVATNTGEVFDFDVLVLFHGAVFPCDGRTHVVRGRPPVTEAERVRQQAAEKGTSWAPPETIVGDQHHTLRGAAVVRSSPLRVVAAVIAMLV